MFAYVCSASHILTCADRLLQLQMGPSEYAVEKRNSYLELTLEVEGTGNSNSFHERTVPLVWKQRVAVLPQHRLQYTGSIFLVGISLSVVICIYLTKPVL